jgi:hypothetical protein
MNWNYGKCDGECRGLGEEEIKSRFLQDKRGEENIGNFANWKSDSSNKKLDTYNLPF